VHGEHDDFRGYFELANLADGLQPVHERHGNVHQDDVRLKRNRFFNGFLAVDRFGAHFASPIQMRADPFAHDIVIVDK